MAPQQPQAAPSLNIPFPQYTVELYEVGLIIQSVLFGLCLAATTLCLYYMLRRRPKATSQYIVSSFLLFLLAYNIVVLAIDISTVVGIFRWSLGFLRAPPIVIQLPIAAPRLAFGVISVPLFLWISDGFLLWRTWIIWTGRRWAVATPGTIWLASVGTGIVWSVQAIRDIPKVLNDNAGNDNHLSILTSVAGSWELPLALSCGVNIVTMMMIAGRLAYYRYFYQRSLDSMANRLYLSFSGVLAESAALSTLSKFLQLFVPGIKTYSYAVVPICTISSSLILLRRTLNQDESVDAPSVDWDKILPHITQDAGSISTFAAGLPSGTEHTRSSWYTRGSFYSRFDSRLVEALGGFVNSQPIAGKNKGSH